MTERRYEVRVYTESEIAVALDRCGKGWEGYPVWIRESHEELRRQLVAETERRESAENALCDLPDNHIGYGECIVIACPVCEHFGRYGEKP